MSINLRRLFKLAAGDYLTERYADASFNLYGPDCSPFCLVNSEQLLTADKLKFTHQPPKMDPIKLDENPAGVPAESPRP